MKIISQPITLFELKQIAKLRFGDMVKAVVDVDKHIMALDAELHADQEQALLEQGSQQKHLWGINLYPELPLEDWVEFDSMINLRPLHNNKTRGVDDVGIQEKIVEIVNILVKR